MARDVDDDRDPVRAPRRATYTRRFSATVAVGMVDGGRERWPKHVCRPRLAPNPTPQRQHRQRATLAPPRQTDRPASSQAPPGSDPAPRAESGPRCAAPRSCNLLRRGPWHSSPVPKAPAPHRHPQRQPRSWSQDATSGAPFPPMRGRDRAPTPSPHHLARQRTRPRVTTVRTTLMKRPRLCLR